MLKTTARSLILVVVMGASLSGCLTLPPKPATAPTPSTRQTTLTMHNAKTISVQVTVPHDLYGSCIVDPALYIQGFQDGYVNQWNAELSRTAHDAGAWLQTPTAAPITDGSSQGFNASSCRASAQEQGSSDGQRQAHNDLLAHPPVP